MKFTCDAVLMGLGVTREIPVHHGLYPCISFDGLCDTREAPVGYGVYP